MYMIFLWLRDFSHSEQWKVFTDLYIDYPYCCHLININWEREREREREREIERISDISYFNLKYL